MKLMSKTGIIHLIRPGMLAQEKPELRKVQRSFDGFIINVTTIAGIPARTADFLRSFPRQKDFIIDPKTYALARHPDNLNGDSGKITPAWKKLLAHFGYEQSHLPLLPLKADNLRRLTAKTVDFQRTCFPPEQLSFLSPERPLSPAAIVAPYFLFTGLDDPWLTVNLEAVKVAKDCAGDTPVLAVILTTRHLLKVESEVKAVAEAFSDLPVNGYLLWFDDMAEDLLTWRQVLGLKSLVQRLSNGGAKTVINMYGGYLSGLLYHWGMSGFCHNVDTGEKRGIDPASGGPGDVPFYIPPLHVKKAVQEVDNYLERIEVDNQSDYLARVCGCQICRWAVREGIAGFLDTYGQPRFDLTEAKFKKNLEAEGYATMHYLLARSSEIKHAEATEASRLIEELAACAVEYRDPDPTSKITMHHLREWARGLAADGWG